MTRALSKPKIEERPEAQPPEPVPTRAVTGGSPLEIFERLASAPNADIEKLHRLLDLHERWAQDQARMAAFAAKNRCESEMSEVVKDAVNPHTGSRFAMIESIHRAIKPIYTREGFSITFDEGEARRPEDMRIVAELQHVSGWSKLYHLDLPYDGKGSQGGSSAMNPLQGRGSTVTYGRRYLETMIFNVTIAGEDVDGNSPLDNVTAEQISEIVRLFKKVKLVVPLDWGKFLKWLEVKSLDELSQEGYKTAMADLNARFAAAGATAAANAPSAEGGAA